MSVLEFGLSVALVEVIDDEPKGLEGTLFMPVTSSAAFSLAFLALSNTSSCINYTGSKTFGYVENRGPDEPH